MIESPVEWYRIDVDARPDYLRTFCTDNTGTVNDVLPRTGQIYLYIFETILVAAGIEYPVSVDTYKVPVTSTGISAFSHLVFHAFRMKWLEEVFLPSQDMQNKRNVIMNNKTPGGF